MKTFFIERTQRNETRSWSGSKKKNGSWDVIYNEKDPYLKPDQFHEASFIWSDAELKLRMVEILMGVNFKLGKPNLKIDYQS